MAKTDDGGPTLGPQWGLVHGREPFPYEREISDLRAKLAQADSDALEWTRRAFREEQRRKAVEAKMAQAEARCRELEDALTAQTERACRFNCDADGSACVCPAHLAYRAAMRSDSPQEQPK